MSNPKAVQCTETVGIKITTDSGDVVEDEADATRTEGGFSDAGAPTGTPSAGDPPQSEA